MPLQNTGYKVIPVNAFLSLILGIVALIGVLIEMMAAASAGFPPVWLAIFLLLPAAFFLDWFLLKRFKQNPISGFTYYSVTRSILLTAVTVLAYKGAGDYVSPIGLCLYAIFVLVSGLYLFKQNHSVIKLVIVTCIALGTIVISGYLYASVTGLITSSVSGKLIDAQTSNDLWIISQDVLRDDAGTLRNGTAKSIAENGWYNDHGDVNQRADNYTYTLLPDKKSFKLCANFYTDTMGKHKIQYPDGSDDVQFHHSGYQCFHYPFAN